MLIEINKIGVAKDHSMELVILLINTSRDTPIVLLLVSENLIVLLVIPQISVSGDTPIVTLVILKLMYLEKFQ